jgi:glycine/D-amino acid oxidase-like deaminating enzyme
MEKKSYSISARDGAQKAPWAREAGAIVSKGLFNADIRYDTLIVGGGITGMTAALLLQNAGKKTALADAHTPGFGTTGGTSAHINTFADTTYPEAESAFGKEGAQLFADAILEGYALIKSQIDSFHISCDYEDKAGYLFAETEDESKQLDEIYKGAVKVGVAASYTEEVPTPVEYVKALVFDQQAQFHPIKYLQGLQKAYLKAGGIILEITLIESIETKDGIHTANLAAGTIQTKAVIYATHMPPNINLFNFECAPYRSYVLGV